MMETTSVRVCGDSRLNPRPDGAEDALTARVSRAVTVDGEEPLRAAAAFAACFICGERLMRRELDAPGPAALLIVSLASLFLNEPWVMLGPVRASVCSALAAATTLVIGTVSSTLAGRGVVAACGDGGAGFSDLVAPGRLTMALSMRAGSSLLGDSNDRCASARGGAVLGLVLTATGERARTRNGLERGVCLCTASGIRTSCAGRCDNVLCTIDFVDWRGAALTVDDFFVALGAASMSTVRLASRDAPTLLVLLTIGCARAFSSFCRCCCCR